MAKFTADQIRIATRFLSCHICLEQNMIETKNQLVVGGKRFYCRRGYFDVCDSCGVEAGVAERKRLDFISEGDGK